MRSEYNKYKSFLLCITALYEIYVNEARIVTF